MYIYYLLIASSITVLYCILVSMLQNNFVTPTILIFFIILVLTLNIKRIYSLLKKLEIFFMVLVILGFGLALYKLYLPY
ncbi:hypothetical protein J422_05758 [Methanocaldococcus villosus KIN24-T80]|uniref:Uncharacterized protein n=1 Tax=Methanocaldococcus villosus KIN24-T80 TaxID=1069083 RepID=N6VXG0_9EURY|nr:hypothetical protein [Methanocaldococcus villosus]ENN95817.1 hypothetical protein J422_05758 [Methanocaldococcus villosus KIN24-T80]